MWIILMSACNSYDTVPLNGKKGGANDVQLPSAGGVRLPVTCIHVHNNKNGPGNNG